MKRNNSKDAVTRSGNTKKILFCVPSLGMGGMERVLVTYSNLLVKRGHCVTVLNYSFDEPMITTKMSERIIYLRYYRPVPNLLQAHIKDILKLNFRLIPFDKWLQKKNAQTLHKKIIKQHYDVEVSFFGPELIRVISGCSDKQTKKLCFIHSENTKGIFEVIRTEEDKRQVFGNIDKVICVSDTVAKNMRSELFWHKGIVTLYNPNDVEYIRKSSLEYVGFCRNNCFVFVMVCRLNLEVKGLDRMVECVARLEKDYKFEVWLIGDGVDKTKIQDMLAAKKVTSICMFGQQDNPYKFMREADMFLCTSRYEGFSLVMSEAVTLGKPVLTTNVSGVYEMLGDNEYGYVVENSLEGIYYGMREILSRPEIYAHYVEKARERQDYFSEEKIIDAFEEIAGI